ncbi:MAG: hypothetical protein ACHRXM_39105 [Isosphaerales bacterium]
MNIDIEVSFKVKVKEEPPDTKADRCRVIAVLLERIAAHPCIALVLRELVRHS